MELVFTIKDAVICARGKVEIKGWQETAWEFVEGGSLVTGGVPDGFYESGNKKGKPRLDKLIAGTERKIIVTNSELRAIAIEYEKLDKCWNCKGTGQQFSSWHHEGGEKHKTCERCSGSGKSKA